jgi:hypothetical protein
VLVEHSPRYINKGGVELLTAPILCLTIFLGEAKDLHIKSKPKDNITIKN